MHIKIYSSVELLAKHCSEFICYKINDAINRNGRAVISLCGGSTPAGVFTCLSGEIIDWNKVYIFWGDERNVPPESKDSNFYVADKYLLSKIKLPESNIFRIYSESDAEKAAIEYENRLIEFFGNNIIPAFDVILLGIGEDGHTASLFPGTTALSENKRFVVSNYVSKLNTKRITLTYPVINNSRNIIFLVSGKNKSEIIHKMLDEKADIPADKIRAFNGEEYIFMDSDAASKLINR